MIALKVTATLAGAVALPPDGLIQLDGLLGAAIAMRDGLPPLTNHEDEASELAIPLSLSACGRLYLASGGLYVVAEREKRYTNRRFPMAEAQAMCGPKLRRVHVGLGRTKSFRLPREACHLADDRMVWLAFSPSDAAVAEVENLLALVRHLGRKRSAGEGAIVSWSVERLDAGDLFDGFPLVRDGEPLRPVPADWPGINDELCFLEHRTLKPPFWWRATARGTDTWSPATPGCGGAT